VSDASFRFNPYAQDDGRIDLGVDLREGTIPAGAGVVITPNPQPEPEDEVPAHTGPTSETETPAGPPSDDATSAPADPGTAAGADPAEPPKPETKVLSSASKTTARTGPKPRTK
jgi:hypothetical protein